MAWVKILNYPMVKSYKYVFSIIKVQVLVEWSARLTYKVVVPLRQGEGKLYLTVALCPRVIDAIHHRLKANVMKDEHPWCTLLILSLP